MQVEVRRGQEIIDVPEMEVQDLQKLLDAGQGREEVRVYNVGDYALKFGGTNLQRGAGLVIEPGEIWVEDSAPDAELYIMCEFGIGRVGVQIIQKR